MDASHEDSRQGEFAISTSPVPVQQLLFQHWVVRNELLKGLSDEAGTLGPPKKETGSIPHWMGKARRTIDATERLLRQINKIQSYLGRDPKSIDPETVSAAHRMATARWVRALIENGESDEAVAGFLRSAGDGGGDGKKRGRPPGTLNSDGQAMLALAVHDSNPEYWTWPRLADWLLGCKIHEEHGWDSDCTVRLKQAVKRLRAFIRELDSEWTVT